MQYDIFVSTKFKLNVECQICQIKGTKTTKYAMFLLIYINKQNPY